MNKYLQHPPVPHATKPTTLLGWFELPYIGCFTRGRTDLEQQQDAPGLRALAASSTSLQAFIGLRNCLELLPASRIPVWMVPVAPRGCVVGRHSEED